MWRSTGQHGFLREKPSHDYTWRRDLYGRTRTPAPLKKSHDYNKTLKLPPIQRGEMSVKPTTNSTYGNHYQQGRVSLNFLPSVRKNREISQYRRHLEKASDEYGEFWRKYTTKVDGEVQVKYSLPDEQRMLRMKRQDPPFVPNLHYEGLVLVNGEWRPVYYHH